MFQYRIVMKYIPEGEMVYAIVKTFENGKVIPGKESVTGWHLTTEECFDELDVMRAQCRANIKEIEEVK